MCEIPQISVIVPVYNVEKYLDRCIKSILAQTYTNYELILIDDGSTDSSGIMCDDWEKKDERIHVFHKKNEGQGIARNLGVLKSQGEYIAFIDSDDYIYPSYLNCLYKIAIDSDADITCCNFQRQEKFSSDFPPIQYESIVEIISSKEACIQSFGSKGSSFQLPHCKLCKRYLIEQTPFPGFRACEDTAIMREILYNSNKVAVIANELYIYYFNPSSTMNTFTEEKRINQLSAITRNIYFFLDKNELSIVRLAVQELYLALIRNSKPHYLNRKILKQYYRIYKQNSKPDIYRIKAFLAVYTHFLYKLLKNTRALIIKLYKILKN